jgi:hypothetical protein
MDKSAIQKAVQWRMEKKSGVNDGVSFGSGKGAGVGMPTKEGLLDMWSQLGPAEKKGILGALLGGLGGGGLGYLAGNSIVKDKDSTGMAVAKRTSPAVLGAGLGIAGGALAGISSGMAESIPGGMGSLMPMAAEKAIEWRIEKKAAGWMDSVTDFAKDNPALTGTGLGLAGGYAAGHLMGGADETPEERSARARKYALIGGGAGLVGGLGYGAYNSPEAGAIKSTVNTTKGAGKLTGQVGGGLYNWIRNSPLIMPGIPNPIPGMVAGGKVIQKGLEGYGSL